MNQPPKRYPHLSIEEEAKKRGIDPRWIAIERRQNEALLNLELTDPLAEEEGIDAEAAQLEQILAYLEEVLEQGEERLVARLVQWVHETEALQARTRQYYLEVNEGMGRLQDAIDVLEQIRQTADPEERDRLFRLWRDGEL